MGIYGEIYSPFLNLSVSYLRRRRCFRLIALGSLPGILECAIHDAPPKNDARTRLRYPPTMPKQNSLCIRAQLNDKEQRIQY